MCRPFLFSLSVWHWKSWGECLDGANPFGFRPGLSHGHPLMEMCSCLGTWLRGPYAYIRIPQVLLSNLLSGNIFSLPVSPTLWTDPSAEKSPTYQNSSSTQGFLRVSRKMVLVLSNFSWGKHRGLSKMLHLPEKPRLLIIDLEPS